MLCLLAFSISLYPSLLPYLSTYLSFTIPCVWRSRSTRRSNPHRDRSPPPLFPGSPFISRSNFAVVLSFARPIARLLVDRLVRPKGLFVFRQSVRPNGCDVLFSSPPFTGYSQNPRLKCKKIKKKPLKTSGFF
ncbi:hypothetical protein F4809DRAFT_486694 [Biscogniauxia mediterranea]|nr:hypothetical protein F4809DRAFT_486694 [Biscogniauxia mediterranea]